MDESERREIFRVPVSIGGFNSIRMSACFTELISPGDVYLIGGKMNWVPFHVPFFIVTLLGVKVACSS